MNLTEAKALAVRLYDDRRDKLGYQEFDHVKAVVEGLNVRPDLQADAEVVAWLHDTLEDGLLSFRELYYRLTTRQFKALLLVTREKALGLTYMDYVRAIRDAPGASGVIARAVKESDLDHNKRRECPPEMKGMRLPGGRYTRASALLADQISRGDPKAGFFPIPSRGDS